MHSLRVGGLAAVDLLATAGLSYLVTRCGMPRPDIASFALVFVILVLVAVCAHEAFCVNTRLGAWVFGRPWPARPTAHEKTGPRRGAEPAPARP